MAKLKKDPISAQDLEHFVANDSDFVFEMRVLARLRALGFECSHAGTYQDPVSEKIRQFDIRALKRQGSWTLRLAVECKNLRPNRPLLLSAIPRTGDEAFHEIIVHLPGWGSRVNVRSVTTGTVYKSGEMVAKKTDHVGREEKGGDLVSDDVEAFERLNQAVNSCRDLVRQSVINFPGNVLPAFQAIVPVLVVPAGLLWQVDYATDGAMVSPPTQLPRSSLFLNHSWSAQHGMSGEIKYRLSHFEIVTTDALDGTLPAWLSSGGFFPD
jgi:hypothetical protein